MTNILDQIMGVQDAAELWSLSPDHIKRLCRDGKVISRNIGKTWIIIKDQPNPKGGNTMKEYKSFEIWKDDLGRWCVYNPDSSYSRESDHKVYSTLKDAKQAIDRYKECGCFE